LQDGIQVTGTLAESPVGMSASSTSNTSTTGINPATQSSVPDTTPTPAPAPTEFTIGVSNPISEADKKISGIITISKQGPLQTATGTISGFPDGGTIGPIKGQPADSGITIDQLVTEMIHTLESSITIKYNTEVKLKVTGKK
jgi:hypothetical protein